MKKVGMILVVFMVSMTFANCSKDHDDNPGNNSEQPGDGSQQEEDDQNGGEDHSGDEDGGTTEVDPIVGSFWDFENTYDSSDNHKSNPEKVTISGFSDDTYSFTSEVPGDGFSGFLTGAMANGQLTIKEDKWIYNGALNVANVVAPDNSVTGVNIPVKDLVIYSKNAQDGEVIYDAEEAETDPQTFKIVVDGLLVLKYNLTITQKAPVAINVNGTDYENVVPVEIRLSNLSSSLSIKELSVAGIDIFESGDNDPVLSTNYYVEGIGFVKSETRYQIPYKKIGDLVTEILGAPMDPGALSVIAPDLKPVSYTLTQALKDYTINE